MKRLRKHFEPKKIRFYHCGEYGEATEDNGYIARPHYHAIIFGLDFDDKILISRDRDVDLFVSGCLEKIWGKGFVTVGSVTFESAAYVSRYIMKKVTGDAALDHYNDIDYSTGEIKSTLLPEYTTMSRRPGIGRHWLDKYESDVYPADNVILRGKEMPVPKYYDRCYADCEPLRFQKVKALREVNAAKLSDDNTVERLAVKEKIQSLQAKKLIRKL